MNHTLFLKIALPAAALPALVVLFLPAEVWPTYADVTEPLSLLIGSLLSVWVSSLYRKQLKVAFLFFAAFLFIYMLAIILFLSYSPTLLPHLRPRLSEIDILSLVQSLQFINYAMLFFFCINLLKAIDVTQLNRNGWILFALTLVLTPFIALYPSLDLVKTIPNLGLAISYIVIRIFDAGLIIVLMPVLWLYIQYLKSRQRQSLTFTVIIFGIVCSTIFDYIFKLILKIFPQLLPQDSYLAAAIPEMLFIYGYLTIAVGLFAHRQEDKWGYNTIDKTMAGELKLVDDK